ncbi:FxsA family protein [Gilliamella sp. ESL0441]|uniref:FxsA family protein n=1 Tax=Gilliamella sp. ESL0441 TaxID=2704654 RepID=UPI001C6A3A44|nr:FxsA family protein [Gilliamella sp. ESL0441]QYN45540.1 FxsA family protein [Gilliamella sp. ESL0441]
MRFFTYLILFLILFYFYCEISLFKQVISVFGLWTTLIFVIAKSIIVYQFAKKQIIKNDRFMQQEETNLKGIKLENLKIEGLSNILTTVGVFLIFLPGFLSDIFGGILLIPNVKRYITKLILEKVFSKTIIVSSKTTTVNQFDEFIEGEFRHKNDE